MKKLEFNASFVGYISLIMLGLSLTIQKLWLRQLGRTNITMNKTRIIKAWKENYKEEYEHINTFLKSNIWKLVKDLST